ncbi:centrosomal protein 15 [Takifugu rubripes]|uniref:centrosomal protein 15 n=1 Tax=Takifugu rubripes TaxID=31033 RepID=UPI001145B775|nr:uncharacterized protein C3orf14 homolog [Takifugu rubripes]
MCALSLIQRAELLKQMEERSEQREEQRRRRQEASQAARYRNNRLLQDLQKLEEEVRGQRLPRQHLLALESQCWVSVSDALPVWEHFLLGEGQHPTVGPEPSASTPRQKPSTARKRRLPPHPKPRATS